MGRGVSRAKTLAVLQRDGFACVTCQATGDLTIDHIFPRVRGGGHEMENLRTLCRRCNSRKSAKDRLTHRGGASNLGEPRALIALRMDTEDVDQQAADASVSRSEMIRRLLAYAVRRMPKGWTP